MVLITMEDIGGVWGKVSASNHSARMPCWTHPTRYLEADYVSGSITDYGLSMVQWMHHRQQRCMGGVRMEAERPTPSHVIDVRTKS